MTTTGRSRHLEPSGRARIYGEAVGFTVGLKVVGTAGISAYRDAFSERGAASDRQPDTLDSAIRWSDAALWVAPYPSGLNAHETVATLAATHAAVATEAGVHPPAPASGPSRIGETRAAPAP